MLRRILAILLLAALMAGCSLPMSTEELLSPPRLTEEQAAIYDALESALGTDAFKLKYPRRGDYLSACIMRDLDHDGVQEALVFYDLTVGGATSSWISILVQRDGVWKSVHDVAGAGSEIDLVSFARVSGQEADNVVVGWSTAGQENSVCVVYSFSSNRLERMHKSDFLYSELLIADVDKNQLDELVLCTAGGSRSAVMTLLKYRSGSIVTASEIELPDGLTGYTQLLFGPLTQNLSAVFADIVLDGGGMTTEIALVEPTGPITTTITRLTEEELGIYESFDRPVSPLTCGDVNNDSYIDIPVNRMLPGYEDAVEEDAIHLTEYKSILEGSLVTVQSSVANFSEGYRLVLPEGWSDAVTVVRQPDTGEWRFVLYGGSLADSVTELLRIKVVSPSDYQDKFETETYRRIAAKGVNEYMAYIPPGNYPGYSIDHTQLESLFSLL